MLTKTRSLRSRSAGCLNLGDGSARAGHSLTPAVAPANGHKDSLQYAGALIGKQWRCVILLLLRRNRSYSRQNKTDWGSLARYCRSHAACAVSGQTATQSLHFQYSTTCQYARRTPMSGSSRSGCVSPPPPTRRIMRLCPSAARRAEQGTQQTGINSP